MSISQDNTGAGDPRLPREVAVALTELCRASQGTHTSVVHFSRCSAHCPCGGPRTLGKEGILVLGQGMTAAPREC